MTLVAGVDSSTQSCKVVVRELESGHVVRTGRAEHPEGTQADPAAWWDALRSAVDATATPFGMTLANTTRSNLARAAIEGVLCGLADGLAAIGKHGDHRPAIAAQYAAYAGARA